MIHNVDPQLSQWDVGRVVSISDSEATHIHFANQGDSKAVIIEIENGSAKIPDYLLQTGKTIIAYAVKDGVTLESKSFSVRKREKPENYVYEDDQRNYIYELITDAETAVANANQATANANTATEGATLATTNANVATNSANLATTKANTAAENANKAVTKANNAVKNMMVVGEAQGKSISLDNAIDQTFVGLRVFGKTTQDGTPTPDAPVDLVSAGDGGTLAGNVCRKNLANYDARTGAESTVDGDGFIIATNGSNITKYVHVPIIAPYGEITVSIDNDSGNDVYIQTSGNDYNINGATSFTRTVTANGWLRVMWSITPGVTSKIRVMATHGTVAMPYEPYDGQTITISTPNGLPGIPVTSGGNYIDANGQQWVCDEIDFARGLYIKRIGEKAFTGAETYLDYISSTGGVSTYLTHLDNTPFACSHFVVGNTARWANAGAILFNAAATGSATMDEFVAFVAEQHTNGTPITVVYILATPIETPLSEEELAAYASLHTYKDNTTVSNDAGAYMALEYVMDAKKYIDSLVTGSMAPATVE